jgi:hypothetical protein
MITVVVYRDGGPVPGAHVIAIHKMGLWWAATVTRYDGVAELRTLPGSYLVVAGDDLGNGAWVDNIEDGELAIVNLVPKTNRRYFVDLELRLPVADPVARVLEALRQFYAKLVEVLGDLASKLGVTVPVVELARVVRLEGVTAVDPRTVRVYFYVGGSPVHVALVIAAPVIAILLLVLAVILVARWVFGEELPAIAKLLAYGVLAGGVASLIVAATGFVRELQRP